MVEFIGLTGPIKFDTSGLRTQFELDLMELQVSGLERVGSWNSLDHLEAARKQEDISGEGNTDPMANKTFVITTILVRSLSKEIGFCLTEMLVVP